MRSMALMEEEGEINDTRKVSPSDQQISQMGPTDERVCANQVSLLCYD